jgi:acetyl esterase/lipase
MKKICILILIAFFTGSTAYCQHKPSVQQLEPLSTHGAAIIDENWKLDSIDITGIQKKFTGIPYANISPTQTLDIYLPDTGKTAFPVIIAVHGGAFMGGNARMKGDIGPVLEGLKRGYAVVSVSYRLAGEATFPRAVNDIKAAIRYVKAHALQYTINPEKVAVWGSSAGGNLVSMIGTTGTIPYLNGDNTNNLEYSSSVQAVVDWFGPCDFVQFDQQFQLSGTKPENGSVLRDDSHESWYIGQNITKDLSFTEKANPESYIPFIDIPSAPYFFIEHGTLDPTVPKEQSIHFAEMLTQKMGKEKVNLVLLDGAKHASPEFRTAENVLLVFQFLDKILKKS